MPNNIYTSVGAVPDGAPYPAILAIGDSWLWYPRNSLLLALLAHPQLRDEYRYATLFGNNGAMLNEYLDGKYKALWNTELEPQNFEGYSVVIISGGGNDAVDYALALHDNCASRQTAEQCMDPAGLSKLVNNLCSVLRRMIDAVHSAAAQTSHKRRPAILLHGYDYPVPDGRPFALTDIQLLKAGPWLKPAMDGCQVAGKEDLRLQIAKLLIDKISEGYRKFHDPAKEIYFIDSCGVLESGTGYEADWINELHPTPSGFDKIIDEAWIPQLKMHHLPMVRP